MPNITITWPSFFEEFGRKLLEYKNDRPALINKLKELDRRLNNNRFQALREMKDRRDMDPYSVMALLAEDSTEKYRAALAERIKQVFGLQAPVPTDFRGLQTVPRLFFYKSQNPDTEGMWKLLEEAVNAEGMGDAETFAKAYDQVKGIKTQSYFMQWIRPYDFLPLHGEAVYPYIKNNPELLTDDLKDFLPVNRYDLKGVDYYMFSVKWKNYLNAQFSGIDFPLISYAARSQEGKDRVKELMTVPKQENSVHLDKHTAWTQFTNAFAKKLWEYRNDRAALMEKLGEIRESDEWKTLKRKYIEGKQGDKKSIYPNKFPAVPGGNDVDPFTVISLFIFGRSFNPEAFRLRGESAAIFGKAFGVTVPAPVLIDGPNCVDGLDLVGNVDADKKVARIQELWDLFAAVMEMDFEKEDQSRFYQAFDQAASYENGRNRSILIFCLSWIQPYYFLSMVPNMRSKLVESKIITDPEWVKMLQSGKLDGKTYLAICNYVRGLMLEDRKKFLAIKELFYSPFAETNCMTTPIIVPAEEQAVVQAPEQEEILEETSEEMPSRPQTDIPRNLILYGPPGTGKTYHTAEYAVAILEKLTREELEEGLSDRSLYDTYAEEGRIAFTTFHQSFGYEDFMEGIKPITSEDGEIRYRVEPGVFRTFCMEAEEHPDQNYVFVIDEINRGNISKIFGELITLIEEPKRIGMPEEMWAVLPYSKEVFGVPENVFVIGTMNTADRSIKAMDTALRRRFSFWEMLPNPEILKGIQVEGVAVDQLLAHMNQKIAVLYDREHTIGHAFFLPLVQEPTVKQLGKIFRDSILPLLQEYFYEDYEKIRLVLGDLQKPEELQFVKEISQDYEALFGSEAGYDFEEIKTYEIQKTAFDRIDAYRSI